MVTLFLPPSLLRNHDEGRDDSLREDITEPEFCRSLYLIAGVAVRRLREEVNLFKQPYFMSF